MKNYKTPRYKCVVKRIDTSNMLNGYSPLFNAIWPSLNELEGKLLLFCSIELKYYSKNVNSLHGNSFI